MSESSLTRRIFITGFWMAAIFFTAESSGWVKGPNWYLPVVLGLGVFFVSLTLAALLRRVLKSGVACHLIGAPAGTLAFAQLIQLVNPDLMTIKPWSLWLVVAAIMASATAAVMDPGGVRKNV